MTSLRIPAAPGVAAVEPFRLGTWQVCALAALWFGATAWMRPLAVPDEGRYVGVAWEMLRGGHVLTPMLDGMPFFHKPPLFYWITEGAFEVFGVGLMTARLASLLAATVTAGGLYAFLRRWCDELTTRWAVVVLATCPIFYAGAQFANLDMLVAACISGAILAAAQAVWLHEAGLAHRRALATAFAALALGVLAKGLIGIVLPGLVLLGWGIATRRWRRVAVLAAWPWGWLLFAAIAAPWFVAEQLRYPDFAHYFFVVQHLQRFLTQGFNSHEPIWFYPVVLAVSMLPWSPLLLVHARSVLRGASADAASPVVSFQAEMPSDLRRLMVIWVVVVLVFFSIPSSKLIGYVLPAVVPLAVLLAEAGRRLLAAPRRHVVAAVAAALCIALAIGAQFIPSKSLAALATQLRDARQPGEPVLFVDAYYYDVTFYARLDVAPRVVDAWKPEDVAPDSWRRELVDARRYATRDEPPHLLRTDQLRSELCRAPSSWVLAPWPPRAASLLAGLPPPDGLVDDVALWHVRRDALRCR